MPTATAPVHLNIANIPEELQQYPQWTLWRGADRINTQTGKVRVAKPPMNPRTLRNASTTDPTTWGTFEQCGDALPAALEAWEQEDPDAYRGGGLSFVLTAQDPYCGVDFDNCRNPETGVLTLWAQQLIDRLASYAEVSPSGTGVHIYVKGQLPGTGHKCGDLEIYDRKKALTVTGHHLDGTPTSIVERQPVIDLLYAAMPILARLVTDSDRREKFQQLFIGDTSEYNDDESRADLALCSLAAHVDATAEQIDATMRLSGLYREKWEREGYQAATIEKAQRAGDGPPAQRYPVMPLLPQSAQVLLSMTIPPIHWVVPGLVAEGLTLLAGGSKIGKSWAALAIGVAVAEGGRVFQYFDTEQGGVLYLALEDGPRRMQSRLHTIMRHTGDAALNDLQLAYQCPTMPGLRDTLADWIDRHPETRLIIVDILGRVQERVRGPQNAYYGDYDTLAPLQRLALDRSLALVLVTHTNQREEVADILHAVMGTTGIVGCADAILILQRVRNTPQGSLQVVSRDFSEGTYDMAFHDGIWTVTGAQSQPVAYSAQTQATLEALAKLGGIDVPTEDIVAQLGVPSTTAIERLNKAIALKLVVKPRKGRYTLTSLLRGV